MRLMRVIFVFVMGLSITSAFSQVEIPVDMYTGTPSIAIPIWTMSSGGITEGVTLSYDANSINQESRFGAGWNLRAGGSISREVRTYPDDVGYQVTTQGWLYTNGAGASIATDIGNFNPAADTLAGTREAGEGTDYTKINGFNYLVDTEPDIFNYSFGGTSGSFVFDNGSVIRTMPFADIKIDVTFASGTDKRIQRFTITTNTGFKYTFDYKLTTTKYTYASAYFARDFYVPTEYEMYNPSVTYTREWKLSRIDSPDGAYITFAYDLINGQSNESNVEMAFYQYPDSIYANPSDILIQTIYKVQETSQKAYLTNITASEGSKIEFSGTTLQTIIISDKRRGSTVAEQYVKSFEFTYLPVTYYDQGLTWALKTAQFLKSVTEYSGCERLPGFKFDYIGLNQIRLQNPTEYYLIASGNGIDLWGYPNGAVTNEHAFPKLYIYPDEPVAERYRYHPIPGSGNEIVLEGVNRNSSSYAMMMGALRSITSPEGGVTSFEFEGNQYLDMRTNQNVAAGGLRIKTISYYDGFSTTPITKTFEYKDPVSGLSSGRLIRRPVLFMPAYKWKSPSGSNFDKLYETGGLTEAEKWKYLTIRTSQDLTNGEVTHGSPVGYLAVTVKRPGAGSARFEYDVPATYGQFTSGSWKATTNRFARFSSTPTMGIVQQGGPWTFPNTVNPEFDFERGSALRKFEYNEAGKLVRKSITTYQRLYKTGSTPYTVKGLKYDRYAGCDNTNKIFFYGKYTLPTEVVKVPLKDVVITYDVNDVNGTSFIKDSTEYFYQSPNHKLITEVRQTTSDGKIYSSRTKYPSDYTYTTTGATEAVMIGNLKTAFRNGIPIEQIQTLTRNDSTWVIGGSVVKLDPMGLNRPMVRSVWRLKSNPPILLSDFQNSQVVNISGYKFKIDLRYERVDSVLAYTTTGDVKSRYNPIARQTSVTGYGYGSTLPVVQLVNASAGQASFSDFDVTGTGFTFSSGTPYYGSGRSGKNAFYPGVILRDTLFKAAVNNYVLSLWQKSNANLTLNVALKSLDGVTTYSTTTFVVNSSGGTDFKYFQKLIPISGSVPATFRVEVYASGIAASPAGGSSPGLLPVIDDVFFYPENADMAATAYMVPFGSASVTTGTGQGSFSDYDKLGRQRFTYDRDRNIVKRNVYLYSTESPLPSDFTWPYPYTPYVGEATTFTVVTNDCVTDATYEWNWGSGFSAGTASQSHTFTSTGTYAVSLRISSPTYGTKTISKSIQVVQAPYIISICATGITGYNGGVAQTEFCDAISDTPPPQGVIYRVSHSPSTGAFAYQWKRRDLGASSWVNVGTNANQYIISKTSNQTSFEIKCTITSTQGWIGTSDVLQFIVTP